MKKLLSSRALEGVPVSSTSSFLRLLWVLWALTINGKFCLDFKPGSGPFGQGLWEGEEKRKGEVLLSSWGLQCQGHARSVSEKSFKRLGRSRGSSRCVRVCVCVCVCVQVYVGSKWKLLISKRNTGRRYKIWGWFKRTSNPQTTCTWLSEVITRFDWR